MSAISELAIEYAKEGFAVFPLKRNRKTPVEDGGFKKATTNTEVVRKFWSQHPFSNIGIACGQQSGGLLVIDLDIKKDEGIDGRESLLEWEAEHGKFPETATATTGSGGQHLYYRVHKEIRPKVNILPGVDIRCDGSYVVAPGSMHESGREYFWDLDPRDVPIAEANDSVLDLVNMQNTQAETEAFIVPDKIEKGYRVNTLFRLTASLQSKGLTDDAIKSAVRSENDLRCNPPLTEKELEKEVFPAIKRYAKGEFIESMPLPGDAGRKRDIKDIRTMTAKQLQDTDYPPIQFYVDNFLTEGVYILAAKSKEGKSWMCLQMAIAVANGDQFLGFRTHQAGVLYIDYENGERLSQSRLNLSLNGDPAPENLYFMYDTELRLGRGFEETVDAFLKEHTDVRIIVIDVLQYVRYLKDSKQSDYDCDYATMAALKKLAAEHHLAVVCIHHLRKMVDENDVFANLLGSTALMGSSDGTIVLSRKKRSDEVFTIEITGRVFPGETYRAKFDKHLHRWDMLGTKDEVEEADIMADYKNNSLVRIVKTLLSQQEAWQGTCDQLKEAGMRMGINLGDTRKIGKMIDAVEGQMFIYDHIEHENKRSMNARLHVFSRFPLPQELIN